MIYFTYALMLFNTNFYNDIFLLICEGILVPTYLDEPYKNYFLIVFFTISIKVDILYERRIEHENLHCQRNRRSVKNKT